MSENSGTPGAAGRDDESVAFDQTGGLMAEFEGDDDDRRNEGAGPDPIGNPLHPGGQEGAVGAVADGEAPQLDPDERNP